MSLLPLSPSLHHLLRVVHVNRLKSAIAAAARQTPPSPYDPAPGSREQKERRRQKEGAYYISSIRLYMEWTCV